MATFYLKVLRNFADKINGRPYTRGDKFVVKDENRAFDAVDKKLAELERIDCDRPKTGKKIIVQQNLLYKIGGIETLNRNLAYAFRNKDLTFLFKDADVYGASALAKYCDVRIDDGSTIECDILILDNYDSAGYINGRVKAGKVYQMIHADFENLKKMPQWSHFDWKPAEWVDKVCAVSDTARTGLKTALGVDSVVVPNICLNGSTERITTFLWLSRASAEKGADRLMELFKKFDEAGRRYRLIMASTMTQAPQRVKSWAENNPSVIVVPPSVYNSDFLKMADYLVQLSLNESYCYSAHEALQNGVAVLGSRIPEFEQLIKIGDNGYIIEDNFAGLDIDKIFDKIPRPKKYDGTIPEEWLKLMEGEL